MTLEDNIHFLQLNYLNLRAQNFIYASVCVFTLGVGERAFCAAIWIDPPAEHYHGAEANAAKNWGSQQLNFLGMK